MFLIRSYLAVLTPVLLFVPFRAILLNFISNFCNRDARHWKPTCEARVCKGNRYQVKEDRISCKAASVFRSGFHKKQAGKRNDFQCLSSSVMYVCVLFCLFTGFPLPCSFCSLLPFCPSRKQTNLF